VRQVSSAVSASGVPASIAPIHSLKRGSMTR
jgi:hypothetical protein